MTDVEWLDEDEMRAWLGFVQASVLVADELERALQEEHGLSLAEYEVLAFLSAEPGWRLRMSDLAERVLLTRSRLTHTVDRLEHAGLVERVACETDRRGSYAALTDAGMEVLREAAPAHVAQVRETLIDRLTTDEIVSLAAAMARVVGDRGARVDARAGRTATR